LILCTVIDLDIAAAAATFDGDVLHPAWASVGCSCYRESVIVVSTGLAPLHSQACENSGDASPTAIRFGVASHGACKHQEESINQHTDLPLPLPTMLSSIASPPIKVAHGSVSVVGSLFSICVTFESRPSNTFDTFSGLEKERKDLISSFKVLV